MATNITVNTLPDQWSSAYDDVVVVFDFEGRTITGVTEPQAGRIRVTVSSAFSVNPPVNTYCKIDSGIYVGVHKVAASTSTTVDLIFAYSSNQTSGTLTSLRVPTFSIYKGFKSGEQFDVALPYTLVTTFTPTFNSDYQVSVNLKALLKRIFTIVEPDLNSGYDYSVFNSYRLVWDTDNETDIRYVLNSSISSEELNEQYLSGDKYLTNTDQPLLWGCGVSFMTKFDGGFPKIEVYNDGEIVTAGFSAAFQSNQFSQGYDV